jgi:assimilatory nitrate reductase catalytic subunit
MGALSLTGQPNAMGGREVGGLANQLAAHMNFVPDDLDRVGRFWNAPNMAKHEGLKAVQMFEAIERGAIKALWVMATNPVVSLPRAGAMAEALRKLELFVVSDNVLSTDTLNAGAHVVLPAAAWGEKDGTVTNSERRISRQLPFLALPDEARPDWWMVAQVAQRMGFEGFAYRTAADVFREHAALSGFENHGTRAFDIAALAALTDSEFNTLAPLQWPVPSGGAKPDPRFFASGGFFTADRKARLHPAERPQLKAQLSNEFPLRLNTGRIRDQWHTMTRSGLSPRLGAHMPDPFVEVHPGDAADAGLVDGAFARLTSPHGSCVLKVTVSENQRRGSLFAPIHWSGDTASCARIGDLVAPFTDPYSGQPEAKATPVNVMPLSFAYRGFALTRSRMKPPAGAWWARVAVTGGHGLLIASHDKPSAWRDLARQLFGGEGVAEYFDEPRGLFRAVHFINGCLQACLFIGPATSTLPWEMMKGLFEAEVVPEAQRRVVLSGKSTAGVPDQGPLVCACFGVGVNTIRAAIANGIGNVEGIGVALRAGTNCGSCVPELKRMLSNKSLAQAV